GDAARGGGDGDDHAAAPLLHAGQEAFEGEEGGQQVAVDGGAPAVLGDVFQRGGRGEAAAGVGDQNVHRAQFALDLAAHRLDVAEAGDVPGHACGVAAVAADPGGHAGHSVGVPAVDGDRGAAAGELGGDSCADAPGAAGNQGCLPVQPVHAAPPRRCG